MDGVKKITREASHINNGSFIKKIMSPEEFKKIAGDFPRKKKIVMCRGAFDIVHPGHIRQLIYSKSKGDLLIVSLTPDQYVTKRSISPYVPHELRAINLAAFEVVDYVIIDTEPTAIRNILDIKPDYYVKGFEYSLNGIHPGAKEEMKALATYGGKFLFSPGDITFSSSKLITSQKPNLSLDQLLTIMKVDGVTFKDLAKTIKKFNTLDIHVIGDLIVDKYTRCTVVGVSQKSPALHVQLSDSNIYVGGAGVVAKHFKALGATVTLTTILGDDEVGKEALKDLTGFGVKIHALIDPTRPTTLKERFLTDNGVDLLVVDKVENAPLSYILTEKIIKYTKQTKANAIICSDFHHGLFNRDSIKKIIDSIPEGYLKIADSQVSNRWGNILEFTDFDLITPNEREARFVLGDQDTTIRPLSQMLYNKAKCKNLIMKLGKDGIMVHRGPKIKTREFFYIDSFVEDLADPIGAGDALLAAAASGLAISNNIVQAAILGNIAAAVECSRMGNEPVQNSDLIEGLKKLENKF